MIGFEEKSQKFRKQIRKKKMNEIITEKRKHMHEHLQKIIQDNNTDLSIKELFEQIKSADEQKNLPKIVSILESVINRVAEGSEFPDDAFFDYIMQILDVPEINPTIQQLIGTLQFINNKNYQEKWEKLFFSMTRIQTCCVTVPVIYNFTVQENFKQLLEQNINHFYEFILQFEVLSNNYLMKILQDFIKENFDPIFNKSLYHLQNDNLERSKLHLKLFLSFNSFLILLDKDFYVQFDEIFEEVVINSEFQYYFYIMPILAQWLPIGQDTRLRSIISHIYDKVSGDHHIMTLFTDCLIDSSDFCNMLQCLEQDDFVIMEAILEIDGGYYENMYNAVMPFDTIKDKLQRFKEDCIKDEALYSLIEIFIANENYLLYEEMICIIDPFKDSLLYDYLHLNNFELLFKVLGYAKRSQLLSYGVPHILNMIKENPSKGALNLLSKMLDFDDETSDEFHQIFFEQNCIDWLEALQEHEKLGDIAVQIIESQFVTSTEK